MNITQDLIDESIHTFDRDSTVLAVSLISKSSLNNNKSNNMISSIKNRKDPAEDKMLLPIVKTFNEVSNKNLDSPRSIKVEIKYNKPSHLSIKDHIDKLKDAKR